MQPNESRQQGNPKPYRGDRAPNQTEGTEKLCANLGLGLELGNTVHRHLH